MSTEHPHKRRFGGLLAESRRIIGFENQRRLMEEYPRLRVAMLIAVLVAIPLWQSTFLASGDSLDRTYRNRCSIGVVYKNHFPYLYYTGLFPVTSLSVPTNGEAGVLEQFKERGRTLTVKSASEHLPVYFYFLDAFITGDPYKGDYKIASGAVFCLGLMVLFVSLWYVRLEILGLVLVILLGSNPFQLFEAYANDNIFSWPISIGLLVTGLFVPVLARGRAPGWYPWFAAIGAGIVLGTARHIRPECWTIIVSALAACLLAPGVKLPKKLLLTVLCLVAFVGAMKGWEEFFDRKMDEASIAVARAGGRTYQEIRWHYHSAWCSMFAGLGDFDTKYGYIWDDRAIFANARAQGKPWAEASKSRILGDIREDPAWFLGILGKRTWRILTENTPPRVSVASTWLTIPARGVVIPFAVVFLFLCLVMARAWDTAMILAFPSTLAVTPLLGFSGYGVSYYSIIHLIAVGAVIALIVEMCLSFRGAGNSVARSTRPLDRGTLHG